MSFAMQKASVLTAVLIAVLAGLALRFAPPSTSAQGGVQDTEVACETALARCLEFESFPSPHYYRTCLRRLAAPLLWQPTAWSACAANATRLLVSFLHVHVTATPPEDKEDRRDAGVAYMAVLAGEALVMCQERATEPCDSLAWENLQITFERLPTIAAAFAQYRAGEISYDAFKYLALDYVLHRGGPVLPLDGLVFGPDGFHNEPFFGPSLVLPTRKLRVFTLMLLRNMFDTDTLMHTVFPVSLQSDVELGAIYLRDALIRLRPKRIFFGDSVAILMTSKLAKKLYDFPERTGLEQAVLRILEDSMEFPPTYPPVGLSKLVPGREAYSPAEVVWSEDDGMRTVGPNMSAVQAAWDQLGGLGTVVVLKREYTEGGRGVSMILRQSDLAAGLEKVYERTGGVGLIDLDLKVRLFLQKEVPITNFIPAVFRFYAHRGQLIAGHLSRVEVATRFGGIGFVTLRDELSEQKAVEFIRLRNYTGFGTLKYWVGKGETWQLDFNPRFERQSCISGILIEKYGNSENAEERALVNKDPCAVFQLWSTGHKFQDCELPIILPAGIRFMDAMRVANLGMVPLAKDFIDMLTGGRYVWNLHRGDASCFRLHQNYLNNYVRDWKNQFEKQ